MTRRLLVDTALLAVAVSTIALTIGATLLLHHVFVGDADGVVQVDVRTAAVVTR